MSPEVIALLHCTRSSLGICASSSGAVAGLVLWQVQKKVLSEMSENLLYCRKLDLNQLTVLQDQVVLIKLVNTQNTDATKCCIDPRYH